MQAYDSIHLPSAELEIIVLNSYGTCAYIYTEIYLHT